MKLNWISILKYVLSLVVALALFWYLYRDQDFTQIIERFSQTNYTWLALSMFVSVISYVSRAWRWTLMLQPLGYQVNIFRAFIALMIGYLANLVVPRMGEVSRCAVLFRTDEVPVNIGFGTVIAERVVDVLMLLSVISLGLLLEYDKIGTFLLEKFSSDPTKSSNSLLWMLLGIGIILLLILVYVFFSYREKIEKSLIYQKIIAFLIGLKAGLLSIKQLSTPNQILFWVHTLIIWLCYYFTAYIIFSAIPATAHLGFLCALSYLITSAISISAPVQGGIGIYHIFVSATLVAYGIEKNDADFFALVSHSSQTLVMIVLGLICVALVAMIGKKKKIEA
ncbi:MAG: UPF0104 family protein [Bacteroidetes bacterium]|nr:MAG: UPF0104 family protein [Bacteroidota bacterium]